MKKLAISLLPVVASMVTVVSAGIVAVQDVGTTSSCNPLETKDRYYYIPSDSSITIYPDDTFGNTVDSLISREPDLSVQIWRHGVISQCTDWDRVSNVVSASDSNGALVIRNDDGCVLSKPNYTKVDDPTAIDAQIHSTIGYRKVFEGAANSLTSRLYYRDKGVNTWTCYPGGNTVTDSDSCPKATVQYGKQNYHTGECINYRVFWCGDGLVNRSDGNTYYANGSYTEECDPESPEWKNRADGKTCNTSCKIVEPAKVDPVCNSTYNNQTKYTETSAVWLSSSDDLCSKGNVKNFKYSGEPRVFTWDCENDGTTTGCTAKQERCGDGIKNGGEQCDYNDKNEINWGNDGCDTSCKQKIVSSSECNDTFYYTLRHKWEYTFYDKFIPSATRYLYDFNVDFVEKSPYDYNQGANPTFNWMSDLGDGVYKEVSTTRRVLKSTPLYQIKNHPDVRSKDNLYIEYNIKYADKAYSSKPEDSKLKTHKECVYYEISWCGDGILDTDWEGKRPQDKAEECDPGSEGTKVLPDGRICNSNCEIEDAPTEGKAKIEKTLKDKVPVEKVGQTLKWTVKVTAKGGDVTDFEVQDLLPEALDYVNYKVVSNSDNLQISGPKGPVKSGSNNIYTWDVKGTLKDGHVLTLEIETKVNKMPKSDDDYRNIACVIDDGDKDCDDDKPDPLKGELKIEKTLEGKRKVESTGEILTWEVKVWAEGGDVTDFEVKDIVPAALKYRSYTVKSNEDGLTVKSPTGPVMSGEDSVYTWEVKGTLKKDHQLIIEVTTEVVKMPKSEDDYRNVACVIKDGKEDCDDDKPDPLKGELKIEKTLEGKRKVESTGEILTWEVKVWAEGGDVTDFEVKDIVPAALKYRSYTVKSNEDGLTVKSPTGPVMSGEDSVYTWEVKGTLKKDHQLIIEVTTEVVKMPKSDDDYRNVACVIKDGKEDCDDDKPDTKPKLWIKKYILDGDKEVKSITGNVGDKITYRIYFGNDGDKGTWVSLKDFLPKGIEIESSELVVNNSTIVGGDNSVGGTTLSYNGKVIKLDGLNINIYSGVYLRPNQTGLMTIVGKPLQSESNAQNRTNFACIYEGDGSDGPIDCDDAIYNVGSGEVMCKSDIKKSDSADLCNGNSWSIPVTCNADGGTADKIEILCDSGVQASGTNISELKGTCTFSSDGDHTVQCKVNGSVKAVSGSNCEGTYNLKHHDCGSGCFPAGTKVKMADGTSKDIEKVKVGDVVLSYNTYTNRNEKNVVKQRIVHENNIHEMYELTINGNVLKVTDVHPFYVRKSDSSKDYDWIEAQDLKIGDILLMNDGTLVKIDKINHYNNQETVYNLEVEGNHDYFVDEGYLVHNKPSSCFIAGTKVLMADGSEKNIEDVRIGEKVLGSNGSVNTVLGYDRPILANRHLWSINGSEYFVSDEHPFKTTEGWKSFDPEMTKLEVNLDTTELKVGDILITNSGLEEIKSVDYISADYDTPLYNFKLDGDHTYYANDYLVHNKCTGNCCNGCGHEDTPYCEDHPNDPMCELANPRCFNVNEGNFSIELGEYLPFYFNVFRDTSIDESLRHDYVFAEADKEYNLGTVDLGSLKCKYKILDPYNNVVYSKDNIKCLQPGEERISYNSLIGKWKEKQKYMYDIDVDDMGGKYWPTISRTKSSDWKINSVLGEYKFQIVVYEYKQYNDEGKWETHTMTDAICQSNFVLTDSYTVQKTPSGNLTASTDTLKKFKEVDGTDAGFSRYLNTISTSEYTPNGKVAEAMKSFSDKYEKLAVTVSKGGKTMKKVPGKNIYFIDGDFSINDTTFSKPFTLVQTNPNKKITIEGDVTNLNMMILTRGDIEFVGNCTSNQTVKGIFYTEGNLKRIGVLHNDSLSNNEWCTKGGLNIKGVLIGKNFNDLMKKGRSHLEEWFETEDKKGEIIAGANIVIEYSPSVFTKGSMPPGAEDFTTALSIYKN